MYKLNNSGPRFEPCGTPVAHKFIDDNSQFITHTYRGTTRFVRPYLLNIWKFEFGQLWYNKYGVTHCIKCLMQVKKQNLVLIKSNGSNTGSYSEIRTSNSTHNASHIQYDCSIKHRYRLKWKTNIRMCHMSCWVFNCMFHSFVTNSQANKCFWFWQLKSLLPWLYQPFNFFPNTVKLSIVPADLKICIQRDVFTQWDTHSYKQWQTLSWIIHLVGLLWEC